MIEFKTFDFDDNERYVDYLHRCIQIPSNASPLLLLANRDKNNVQRAYAENLCWQKFSADGMEIWGAPFAALMTGFFTFFFALRAETPTAIQITATIRKDRKSSMGCSPPSGASGRDYFRPWVSGAED